MIDQLAVARARREDDNANTSPVDLLQTIIADIQDGEIEADGVIVVAVHRPENGDWNTHRYRCGMKRVDEVAFLELARSQTVDDWKNG